MMTQYEVLYANLLPKFRSYEILLKTTEEVKEELHDYLIPAITRFHVCRKDLSDRNDALEAFNARLSDDEVEILSNFMLLEYIDSTYVRTPSLLKPALSSTDFNAFSPGNMLDKLLAMQKRALSENEALLSRYAWLGGEEENRKNGALEKLKKNSGRKKELI